MRHVWIAILLFVSAVAWAAVEDNVVIEEETTDIRLKASKGRLASVKISENSRFVARRADADIFAAAFYGDGLTIDKASAPGSTPVYRTWEDEDMFYTGSRVCVLPVSLKKDKPVKVLFERTYTSPEQFAEVILASPMYATLKSVYRFFVPTELAEKIRLTPHNLPEGVELKCEYAPNGDRTYSVSLGEQPTVKREKLGLAPAHFLPRIEVSGFFSDTDDLYSFLRSKVEDREDAPEASEFARDMCEGLTDDIARIDTISSWVRNNIRYIAIEHGEYAYRPDAAESVFAKRFGDCKGSANLIRTMLQAVGIDGRLVWIGTHGDVTGSWTVRPSLAAGNHMIAAAVLPDTTIFIDGTVANAPAGLIPSSIAGRECIILNGQSCLIDTVPFPPLDANAIELTGSLSVGPSGLEGDYSARYTGECRRGLESALQGLSVPRRKSALEQITAFGRKGVRPENISVSTPAVNAPYSVVSYSEADASAFRELASGKAYLLLRPFRAARYPSLDARNRRSGIDLGRYTTIRTALTCLLPEGYTLESVPERADIKSPWFEGFVDYSISDDGASVVCEALLRCIRTEGQADEVARWNEAVRQIESASSAPVVLMKSPSEQ